MLATSTHLQPHGSFIQYVDSIAVLLSNQHSPAVAGALNGQVAAELRARVPLAERRKAGAFFTSPGLAKRLIANCKLKGETGIVVDPACGAGDLLLAVAQRLPAAISTQATLERWGRSIHGRDVEATFVRAARLRLALLAAQRTGDATAIEEDELARLLPNLRTGDGRDGLPGCPSTIIMNPPFGNIMIDTTAWGGTGLLNRAASFTSDIISRAPEDSRLYAILPDVLRSGSRYGTWRRHVQQCMRVTRVDPVGQFDRWADVDVFILRGRRRAVARTRPSTLWTVKPETVLGSKIEDAYEVRVGTVVPHRDPEEGHLSPYVRAKDLPTAGEHHAGTPQLRHSGRRFDAPFVVVRRTSRPTASTDVPRIIANVVLSDKPVLVENHLLVCQPKNGSVDDCRRLIDQLRSRTATAWLNRRIRCRHLTVAALREVPLGEALERDRTRSVPSSSASPASSAVGRATAR